MQATSRSLALYLARKARHLDIAAPAQLPLVPHHYAVVCPLPSGVCPPDAPSRRPTVLRSSTFPSTAASGPTETPPVTALWARPAPLSPVSVSSSHHDCFSIRHSATPSGSIPEKANLVLALVARERAGPLHPVLGQLLAETRCITATRRPSPCMSTGKVPFRCRHIHSLPSCILAKPFLVHHNMTGASTDIHQRNKQLSITLGAPPNIASRFWKLSARFVFDSNFLSLESRLT